MFIIIIEVKEIKNSKQLTFEFNTVIDAGQ